MLKKADVEKTRRQSEQWWTAQLSVSRLNVRMCVESGSEHDVEWEKEQR